MTEIAVCMFVLTKIEKSTIPSLFGKEKQNNKVLVD